MPNLVFTILGAVITVGVSGVVSWFCLAHLLDRRERIGSWGEFEAWRLAPFAVFAAMTFAAAFFARRSELVCDRSTELVCTLEQRRAFDSFERRLPSGSLRGSRVEERMGTDSNGDAVWQTRLVLELHDGPFALTDWGQRDAHALKTELDAFLGDAGRRHLALGQDSRWFFYPQVPMWLLVGLFILFVRW